MNWWKSLLVLAAAAVGLGAAPPQERAIFISGARIFDGTGAPATIGNVLVRGDRIAAVGRHLRRPRGARLIDARGLTLLPGLHDLHTHLRAPAFDGPEDLPKAYAGHLVNGITTVNEFSVSGEMIEPIRRMTLPKGEIPAPNLQLAVRIGVPGGHGTEYGWGPSFTLEANTARAGELAAKQALAYRPDVIKVFADGWRYGRVPDLNSMNDETLAAIVKQAHAANVPVMTHTVTVQGAKVAASAGVDALGHGIGDALVDDELIALMKKNNTAYVPTMVVYEPQQARGFIPLEWQRLVPGERSREERRIAEGTEPASALETRRWAVLQENLRRLKKGGIRIGIGTDAGIGGVYHGSSALREIRLMTTLGLTPSEALASATSVSASILRKKDHGRIAPGQRADLILIGGRPDQRIEDIHDVRRVFVAGREVALQRLWTALRSDQLSPLPVHRMSGSIDTGRGEGGRTDLGTLPSAGSEAGIDNSRLHFVRASREGKSRLLVTAQLGANPEPFALLTIPLTRGGIELADASGFTGIAFTARGPGRNSLILDSYGIENRNRFRTIFETGQEEREIRLPFSAFQSPDTAARLDLARLRGLVLRLEGEAGTKRWLELGELRFYR